MYCGADLPVSQIETAPAQRILEPHERAFNTILDPQGCYLNGQAKDALAAALGIEISDAVEYISSGKRMPVARCQTRHEAELIAELVRRCGFRSGVVADDDLMLHQGLVRARRVVCVDEMVCVAHMNGTLVLPASEITLLVVGFLRSGRVDYSEAPRRGKSQDKTDIRDSFEFQSERALLDVYSTSLEQSFRIAADSFDYSGLVQPLSYRAEMNFQSTINALRRAAPGAAVDHDFQRLRELLSRVWPERSHTESRGIKRTGIALRPVAQASVVSDNRDQFERYSRLMFLSSLD
ncbi:MAG TPA: hypothetical protein VFV34_04955 [Blastocatellia bacterium]|nr:hypothetical protein [Blastocatellia bacterium]